MSVTLSQFKQVCQRLNEAQVRYVVIGGFAILLHGYERITRDIDLLIDSSEENIQKIKKALIDLLPEACSELATDDVLNNVVVRMVGEDIVVDLMGHVGPIDYFQTKVEKEDIDGVTIPVADLDTMLILKGGLREQDKRDFLFLKGKKTYLERQKNKK